MLLDLLQLREAGVDADDVDRYVDERRTVHDAAFPPLHAGEAAIRRFFAAVSPYGAVRELGRGAAWARLRGVTRRHAPRRVVAAVHASTRPRGIDAVGFDWYDPVASHALRVPGRRTPDGRAGLVVRPGATGTSSRTRRRCAPGAAPSPRCAPAFRCGWWRTAWRRGCRTGGRSPARTAWTGPATSASTWARWPMPWRRASPVRAYFHWSLMDNYEWGTYEPRYGLFGMDRSDPSARALHGHGRPGRRRRRGVRPRRGRPARRGPLGAGPAGLSSGTGAPRTGARGRPGRPPRADASDGPSISSLSRRRWRTTSTTITTRMRPSTTSDAMPVAFSTRWPTK